MYTGTHIDDAVAYVEAEIMNLLGAIPGVDAMFEVKDNEGTVSVIALDPRFSPFVNMIADELKRDLPGPAHPETGAPTRISKHGMQHGVVVYPYVDPAAAADPNNDDVHDAFGFHLPQKKSA